MKKPLNGLIVRLKQKDKSDLKLRRSARTLQRMIMMKMAEPEMQEKIHQEIVEKAFPMGKI